MARRREQKASGHQSAPVEVSKPFPWGTVATSGVLVGVLGGILGYAVLNQGAGFVDPLQAADERVAGVKKYDDLDRAHVVENVDYPQDPPVGGKHAPVWTNCQGTVFTEQVPEENVLHSMEHGAAWVTYRPDLPDSQIEQLADEVDGRPYRVLSPRPGQEAPVVLTAWGRQVAVESVDDNRVTDFLDAYSNGPQTPEKGATCAGGTLRTGEVPVVEQAR